MINEKKKAHNSNTLLFTVMPDVMMPFYQQDRLGFKL